MISPRLAPSSLCLLFWCVALALCPVGDAAPTDQAQVAAVRFAIVRPPGDGATNWLEMTVEINARPATNTPGRVTERVRVEARLGYERPVAGGTKQWRFYRAHAGVVGLVSGRNLVRFYLPPEIVRRDALADAPEYWDIMVGGDSLAPSAALTRHSTSLATEAVYRGFLDKVSSEGGTNDGVLQPQFLTPFRDVYTRDTPTFTRTEAWR
ncbi:MAG: hypothetical protein IT582_09050 [Opitutaceae bacterium]|nr:hypothetical protein [Opitutaceae bacterium]